MQREMTKDTTLSFHIQVLFDELRARKQKNALYSMRAFANQLEIHPSALSRAMAGKEELSLQACLRMIKRLPLSEDEKLRFVTSVADEKYERAMRTLACEFAADSSLSLIPDRIAIFDRDGRYVLLSPRPPDFIKRSISSILGKKPSEIGFPDDLAARFEKQVADVFRTRLPSTIEFEVPGLTEQKRFIRTACGLLGADGEIDRVLCHKRLVPAVTTKEADEELSDGKRDL